MAHENDKQDETDDQRDHTTPDSERDPNESEQHDAPAGPIDLEPPDETEAKPVAAVPVEDVEHCPSCGAPMPERDAIVCLRCGYDLKSLRVTRTALGEVEVGEDDEDDAEKKPIAQSGRGRGDWWLPLVIGGVSGVILVIGYLSGALGLFPAIAATGSAEVPAVVPLGERFVGLLRFFVLSTILAGCGIAGLFLLAQTLDRPMGDLKLVAARVLGIVLTVRLVTFLSLPGPNWFEWMTEAVLQAAGFIGLSIFLFAIKPRDGAVMGGFALLTFVGIWLVGRITVWSIEGAIG